MDVGKRSRQCLGGALNRLACTDAAFHLQSVIGGIERRLSGRRIEMQQVIVDVVNNDDSSSVESRDEVSQMIHHHHALNDEYVGLPKKLVAFPLSEIGKELHFDIAQPVQRVTGIDQAIRRANGVAFQLVDFNALLHTFVDLNRETRIHELAGLLEPRYLSMSPRSTS